ncbi:MAG TPA: class A beta-lactamase [Acidiphilium sp.]
MTLSPTRRGFLLATASTPLFVGTRAFAATPDRFAALETASGGRLGVAALNTATGATIGHRQNERFAFCSTNKMIVVSGVLKRSETETGLLDRRITYTKADLLSYAPVTSKHVATGMTVETLCAAALEYSDNTAENLLIRLLGGPKAVTAWARSIGDTVFRIDRLEPELNTAIPGDPRDTTTPAAMTRDLHGLALGTLLGPAERTRLVGWMKNCKTGGARIRAGVPAGWTVADKTGTGDYGTTNDIGVIWPPGKPPIVLTVYFTQPADKGAKPKDDVLASAARIVTETFD